jgi:peptidoglycan/xylan/chitin deacetylase (PgdA/CDA1 family)
MRRRAFLVGAAAGAVVAACSSGRKPSQAATPGTTTSTVPVPSTQPTGPAVFVPHGPSTATGVALTFHTAGDTAITHAILDQAARLNAKLTFFVVGTWLAANPDMAAAIQNGGHELGNHTWSHINLPHLAPDAMYAEISKCGDALRTATGSIGKWFRPSQTDVPSAAILDQAGRAGYATSVGYDVDPLDYQDPGSSLIVSRTRAKVRAGSIVSLHTLYQGTADAFTGIVSAVRAKGLEPVTVSALLGA